MVGLLLKVDYTPPAKVVRSNSYLDQSPRLKERDTVPWLGDKNLHLCLQFEKLLPYTVIQCDLLFVFYHQSVTFGFKLHHRFLEGGDGRVVLKLVEGPLQHVLWIDLFHTQQVEYHVVGEVEGTVQRVSLPL